MPVTVRGTDILFNDNTTQSTAAGAPTTAQVLSATAGASVGAVGTYALMKSANTTAVGPGGTKAGSNLRFTYANDVPTNGFSGTAGSGTWRCMGNDPSGVDEYSNPRYHVTVWLRIS
jgi:hypothetical protein